MSSNKDKLKEELEELNIMKQIANEEAQAQKASSDAQLTVVEEEVTTEEEEDFVNIKGLDQKEASTDESNPINFDSVQFQPDEEKTDEEKKEEEESTDEEETEDIELEEEEPHVPTAPGKMNLDSIEFAASESELKKAERQLRIEKAKSDKARAKEIKLRQAHYKKNPLEIVRYEVDNSTGLTNEQVEERTLDGLVNALDGKSSKSLAQIISSNVFTFFNILIFIIAGFLVSVGAYTDLVFLLIVTINIILGIIQEIRAKKMIDSLSLMSAPSALVIRNGKEMEIGTGEVVLDDIICLETGNQICADSIVVDGTVEVNESLLTGESDAIVKRPGDILYSGSFVVSGKARAKVDKVGKDNYIERLSSQAKAYKKPQSDLLISLNTIIKVMIFPVIFLGGTLFVTLVLRGSVSEFSFSKLFAGISSYMDLKPYIRKTAGAMIGMIPSGLFLMSSIALFVGVIRLAQRKVLVQELYCIEMLARVNCICLDKTGTITDGTMNVKNVVDYNVIAGLSTKNIISAMLNALKDNNLTSKALQEKFGLGKRIKTLAAIPFSSQRKYQAVTFDKFGTFILGAPEFVLKDAFKMYKPDVDKNAALGYRVLCLAHKDGMIENGQLPEGSIEVVSMILIEDNIRPDAINTIKYFRESGVQVKVISGDNPITVSKISQRAGVDSATRYISLDGLSDAEVEKAALKYTVFGRVSPAQKKLLVKTLKANGMTVAMTGDGVNDILALKEADCSIAVASGSEAARNCSHLVLIDSNFDSMPAVVAEGRRVINNVTAVAALFLTKTIFSLLLAIVALIVGDYPISTNQLILIDTLAIGLPSLFLIMEPNNKQVSGKFLVNVIKKALPGAITILIISIFTFALADVLYIDSRSLSTIIVIAATHTCLMVLFKTCRPFNNLRRGICTFSYTVFIIAIFVLPQYLEIRPLVGSYYSSSLNEKFFSKYPNIEISKENYYIINGKATNISGNSNATLSCKVVDGKNYYSIGNESTGIQIEDTIVSYATNGEIFIGGYKVDSGIPYDKSYEFIIKSNGDLYTLDTEGTEAPVMITLHKSTDYYVYKEKYGEIIEGSKSQIFNVRPIVEINQNICTIRSAYDKVDIPYARAVGQITSEDLTIDEDLNLRLFGSLLYIDNDNKIPYKVTIPQISYTYAEEAEDREIYLNGSKTSFNVLQLYGLESKLDDKEGTKLYTVYEDDNLVSYRVRNKDGVNVYDFVTGPTFDVVVPEDEFVFKNFDSSFFADLIVPEIVGDAFAPSTAHVEVTGTNGVYANPIEGQTTYKLYGGALGQSGQQLSSVYCSLANQVSAPVVTKAEANHYIIDGYYTTYEMKSIDANPHFKTTKDKDGEDVNLLVLAGDVTDYKLPKDALTENKEGMVKKLSVVHTVFLLCICLVVAPIMKLLQNIIPWIKQQSKNIQKLLNKF